MKAYSQYDIAEGAKEDIFLKTFFDCVKANRINSDTSPDEKRISEYPTFNMWAGLESTKYLHYLVSYSEVGNYSVKEANDKEIVILEVGIRNGGGLAMWASYIGQYCELEGIDKVLWLNGIDINPACAVLNIFFKVDILSQEDLPAMEAYAAKANLFNIIIDDASHEPYLTFLTWCAFSKKLKNGGSYVIEDAHSDDHPNMIKLDEGGYVDNRAIYIEKILHDAMFVQKDICCITVAPRIITIKKSKISSGRTLYENSMSVTDRTVTLGAMKLFKARMWNMLDLFNSPDDCYEFRAIELVLKKDRLKILTIPNVHFMSSDDPEKRCYVTFNAKIKMGHLTLNDHRKDTIMFNKTSE